MKQIIFYEILKKLKQKPNLVRKVKAFAVAGGIGFIFASGLLIWAGLSAAGSFASRASQIYGSPATQQHLESLKAEIKGLPKVQPLNCWGKAQSLMAVEPWLARSALENLINLKAACLEEQPFPCEGSDCSQMRQMMKSTEGSLI